MIMRAAFGEFLNHMNQVLTIDRTFPTSPTAHFIHVATSTRSHVLDFGTNLWLKQENKKKKKYQRQFHHFFLLRYIVDHEIS